MVLLGKVVQNTHSGERDQAVTLRDSSAVKTKEEIIQIDPQLVFQRLITLVMLQDNLLEAFQYELCSLFSRAL